MHAFVCLDTTEVATKVACIKSHEDAQLRRDRGQLIESRAALVACVDDACPSAIRADCAQLLVDVEASIPSIVIEVKTARAAALTIRIDGAPVAYTRGLAMRVNPGVHKLEVSSPEHAPVLRSVIVHVGDRNQRVVLDLDGTVPAAPLVAPPPPPAAVERTAPSAVPAYVAAGIGVAGFASFGILAGLALSRESELADTCSPRCAARDVQGVRTRYIVADVGLVVGVVSAVVATWLFLRPGQTAAAAR